MKITDIAYMELMQYGVNLLQKMGSYELLFYLMLYINIVNSHHLKLIQKIFDCFDFKKIIKPLDLTCLSPYEENLKYYIVNKQYFLIK